MTIEYQPKSEIPQNSEEVEQNKEAEAVKNFQKLRESKRSFKTMKSRERKRSTRSSKSPFLSSDTSGDQQPGKREHLRKKIVDISKTKKRKEFDHDNSIIKKMDMLIQLSQNSRSQTHLTKKVGKKILSNIEQQIDDLLQLRNALYEISNPSNALVNLGKVSILSADASESKALKLDTE